jgi:2-methylcitrate dehydratase PrpD
MKTLRYTTEQLARAALALRAEDLSRATRAAVGRCILDLLGAAWAGSRAASATALRRMAAQTFPPGPAAVWFSAQRLPPAAAAMVNAGEASALDLDDGHRGAAGHPGAAIIPAVFAMAQASKSSPLEIMAAIAVGYEVGCRVAAARDIDRLATLSTGRWAPYGVAAAVGRLQGVAAPLLAQALAIAGTQAPDLAASGYSKVMGNHVKEGIPWAVLTGISAVALAREGFTGPLDILDHPDWFDARRILAGDDFGRAVEAVYFKPYSSCRWSHAAIDALAAILAQHPLDPSAIRKITVETFTRALRLTNEPDPDTLEGAQYSIPFCLAVAACQGADSLLPLAETSLHDPRAVALARRVELKVDADLDRLFPAQTPARVIVETEGDRIEKTVLAPRGDPANPLNQRDLEDKFRRLAGDGQATGQAQAIIEAVAGFEAGGLAPLLESLPGGATRR